jgi:hypothetical protein
VRITETLIAGAILVCVLAGSARAGAPDACELRVPKVLARALLERFPEYRLPRVDDVAASDAAAWREAEGGDACTLAAIADFDGDGSLDVAAVMPSRRDASPLLVASLYRGGAWDVRSLPFWSTTAARSYAEPLPPGTYRRTKSLDSEPDSPAERRSIKSSRVGFVSGTMESTGVAYFYDGGSWVYVWIAN